MEIYEWSWDLHVLNGKQEVPVHSTFYSTYWIGRIDEMETCVVYLFVNAVTTQEIPHFHFALSVWNKFLDQSCEFHFLMDMFIPVW